MILCTHLNVARLKESTFLRGFDDLSEVITLFTQAAGHAIAGCADIISPVEDNRAQMPWVNSMGGIEQFPVLDGFGVAWF